MEIEILQETGDTILQEDGDTIVREELQLVVSAFAGAVVG